MNQIYFSEKLDSNFLNLLEKQLKERFAGCKKIAVKMHFGEEGNATAFVPEDIKPFIDILAKNKLDYFLYDSPSCYEGIRDNPISHKKYAESKGFKSLGKIETEDSFVSVKGKYLNYEVMKKLVDADAVLVISHFKGHGCCGFGGAIKNLGMGALSKKTKAAIHEGGKPVVLDNCNGCKVCEKACPFGFLKIENGKHVFLDCYGCSNCIIACPQKALKPKVALFDTLLAEGASVAQSKFKNYFYINVAKRITKRCDCEMDSKGMISEDIGYFFGCDAVAIDKACLDAVIKLNGDIFKKFNNKTGIEQIQAAQDFGMGNVQYNLVS